jgi:hypothetical protein
MFVMCQSYVGRIRHDAQSVFMNQQFSADGLHNNPFSGGIGNPEMIGGLPDASETTWNGNRNDFLQRGPGLFNRCKIRKEPVAELIGGDGAGCIFRGQLRKIGQGRKVEKAEIEPFFIEAVKDHRLAAGIGAYETRIGLST